MNNDLFQALNYDPHVGIGLCIFGLIAFVVMGIDLWFTRSGLRPW